MQQDTVIGILGSVLLVACMAGVFAYEAAHPVSAAAGAPMASVASDSILGAVDLGSSDKHGDLVTAAGPHNLTFLLDWHASTGRATLKLTVTPPASSGLPASSTQPTDSESVSLVVPIPAGTVADGNWTVQVDYTAATPSSLPGGIPAPTSTPGSTQDHIAYAVGVKLT